MVNRESDFQYRQAAGLTYYSKQMDAVMRVKQQAAKWRKRLPGADYDHYPPRPRGMHRKRYEKLVRRLRELDAKTHRNWVAFLGGYAERYGTWTDVAAPVARLAAA